MKKQDELNLWNMTRDIKGSIWWEDWFERLNIPLKRGMSIIEKWSNKGILNYGVSLRSAWIEDKSKFIDDTLKSQERVKMSETCSCACHELEENHEPDDCYCMRDNDNFYKYINEQEKLSQQSLSNVRGK